MTLVPRFGPALFGSPLPRSVRAPWPIGNQHRTTANQANPVGEAAMFPSLPSLAATLSQPFKRSQLGLFHGKTKQYGNNVPFSKKKTRRSWLPNIQSKRLYSDALGETVRVKLSTRALKTIRKVRPLSLLSNHITTHISCPVRRDRPVCAQHKVGLTRLGGHASTRRSERGTGQEGIRGIGIALSIWATYTWYSLQPA